jgi:hypothetical protein
MLSLILVTMPIITHLRSLSRIGGNSYEMSGYYTSPFMA